MTDFIVPVLVGAAAALLPLIAHWYWQRRRDSVPGVGRSLADVVRGWARRAKPAVPEAAYVTAPPEAFAMPAPPRATTATDPPEESPPAAEASRLAPSGEQEGQPTATPKPAIRRPGKASGRSTIQLDPLDALVDNRRARITVGALIDDLEQAKVERRT